MTSPEAGGGVGAQLGQLAAGVVLLGKYRIERLLGAGGMGVVYAAHHLMLDRPVAIKLLAPHAALNQVALQRFLNEARNAARIDSEYICRVMDLGVLPPDARPGPGSDARPGVAGPASTAPYIVMELLVGMDLAQLLAERGRLPVREAVGYVIHALSGIRSAHLIGVVHRDLKPSNLFLAKTSDGRSVVKVLDFGISKAMGPGGQPGITADRNIIGSPAYMSPEQAKSSPTVDARADIWTVGVILYELLTCVVPFAAPSIAETLADVLGKVPPPVTQLRPDVPPGLAAVIARCLEKDPALRFQDAGALALALGPFGPWWQPDARVTALPDLGRGWALQSLLDLEGMAHAPAAPPASSAVQPGGLPSNVAPTIGETPSPPTDGVKTVDAWTPGPANAPQRARVAVAIGAALGATAVAGAILLLSWILRRPAIPTATGATETPSAEAGGAASSEPAEPPRDEAGSPAKPGSPEEPTASASAEIPTPAPTRKTTKPGAVHPPHRSDLAKQRR
jgi:serine/threonine-protein kinase